MGLFDDVLPKPAPPAPGLFDDKLKKPGMFDDVLRPQPPGPDPDALPAAPQSVGAQIASPLTELWGYDLQIEAERRHALAEQFSKTINSNTTWDTLKNEGKLALDAVNYAWSPVSALERSFVGAPVERAFDVPHEFTETALDVGIPFLGEETALAKTAGATRAKAIQASESELVKPFRAALAPASMGESAAHTAELTRETWGNLAMRTEQAQAQVEGFRSFMAKLPESQQLQFIYRHERGMEQPNEVLNEASRTLRSMFDDRVKEVQGFGEGHLASVIEDYFPHIWEDPKKAADAFGQTYGKSPLMGSKSFLRERVHQYVSDGLAAGMKLVDQNPINLALLKVREMDRFIMGKRLVDQFKEDGTLKFFPPGKLPPGWKVIDDPVARVRQWSEQEMGFVDRGQYAAPENAARVLNNSLNPSKFHGVAAVDALRSAGNALNMTQLGLSAFHLGFTTIDSITSRVALGVKQFARGELAEGAKSIGTAPVAPFTGAWRGNKLRAGYLHPGIATPEMAKMVEAVAIAGGRVRMPRIYGSAAQGSFIQAAKDGTLLRQLKQTFKDKGVIGGSFNTAARLAETTSHWMMEGVVPRMKLGVFYDMVNDTLRANPKMSPEEFRRVVQKHWNSVDNRMGEMVYDNLFWNKTLKDASHLAVRSVGWNLGTFRELGGGVTDSVKLIDALARGDKAAFTDRMAYLVALPFTTAVMGGMINYWRTGEAPKELKDYYFPRTGKLTKYGTPDRMSLPSYMKDIYEYGHDAGQTLINKANPLIPLMHQMWTNRDFFGYPITDRAHADPTQFLKDYITFLGKGSMPFSVQGIMHQADKDDGMKKYLALIGLTPAPGYITSPEQMAEMDRKREEQLVKRKQKRDAKAAQ